MAIAWRTGWLASTGTNLTSEMSLSNETTVTEGNEDPPEEELHGSTTTREATECIHALSENHAHIYFPRAIPLSMAW